MDGQVLVIFQPRAHRGYYPKITITVKPVTHFVFRQREFDVCRCRSSHERVILNFVPPPCLDVHPRLSPLASRVYPIVALSRPIQLGQMAKQSGAQPWQPISWV